MIGEWSFEVICKEVENRPNRSQVCIPSVRIEEKVMFNAGHFAMVCGQCGTVSKVKEREERRACFCDEAFNIT